MADDWKHDAILRDWFEVPAGDGRVVIGHIYDDSKGRFPDGIEVRTSFVVSLEGDRLTTRNTRYLLERPMAGTPPTSSAVATGDRVLDRRFGAATIVALYGEWAWCLLDSRVDRAPEPLRIAELGRL